MAARISAPEASPCPRHNRAAATPQGGWMLSGPHTTFAPPSHLPCQYLLPYRSARSRGVCGPLALRPTAVSSLTVHGCAGQACCAAHATPLMPASLPALPCASELHGVTSRHASPNKARLFLQLPPPGSFVGMTPLSGLLKATVWLAAVGMKPVRGAADWCQGHVGFACRAPLPYSGCFNQPHAVT